MAKAPNSVIGVDLGRYSLKSVLLQKKGSNRYVLTNFASQVVTAPAETADALAQQLKALFKEMGGSAKACAVAVSTPDALIRIIEQPETPPELLREALRLNGMALLNQDCREFVLDCDRIAPLGSPTELTANGRKRYLVGGLPRSQVNLIGSAVEHAGTDVSAMQLAPICAFNAFEFAYEEIFNHQAFFLVDIGHTNSTMMVGLKRELVLVRNIDFGGKALVDALTSLSGEGREAVLQALEQEDEVMVEFARVAINALVREIQNSIGFLEHRHEQTIPKIYITGGPAKSQTLLKVFTEELRLPCEAWSAVSKCESALPAHRTAQLNDHMIDLNVACGAAAELLKAN
ncbi:Tfp pilus assembly protein ATPase PilM-like protein [Chthoniobacter flavus Ellin428]|uniref:Tfp pilus assembly protein ATPase PilM-like protein n=1 Tax=Chthoniobacter flavus Ellin428 TaxID=497964 RepID=B4D1D7_9BACT|nr:pilus assembly protein PilM [Chthoniobacter flavus]EDY19549.1 Tfp pilus assembly protein ATPase PilM-like protein [Chthoniobacter flavus Ellin428]TCO92793.1 type IV pilus assembly protein PilM [Chthoniobacter flavus]